MDVRDGLKQVQRRLLHAMDELKLKPGQLYKSANIVERTVRTFSDIYIFNEFSDMSPYEAYDTLVHMVQGFSVRYPLVDRQGYFSSIYGDPPSGMYHSEAMPSKIGDEMLHDIHKEIVDFTGGEPMVLPSVIPNLLINGSGGIEAGIKTNMAPHNLVEICNAICAQIDNPDITIDELMRIVPGPDFPTGGVVYGSDKIREVYKTGRGELTVRGKYHIETSKTGRERIVFTEIPYTLSVCDILDNITALKRGFGWGGNGIDKVIDETSRSGEIRIVIELKKGADVKFTLQGLFFNISLQTSYNIVNLALVDGEPQCLNMKELIHHFIEHRKDMITRQIRYGQQKAWENAAIDESKLLEIIKDETQAIAEKYGDKRRTEIVADEADCNFFELLTKGDTLILISNTGYIKRVPVQVFKKETQDINHYTEQIFFVSIEGHILFISNTGKAYVMEVREVPEGDKGSPINSLLAVSPDEEIIFTYFTYFSRDYQGNKYLFMGTARGNVKKVKMSKLANAGNNGITVIDLDEGDTLVSALSVENDERVLLISRRELIQCVNVREMRQSTHSIGLPDEDGLSIMLRWQWPYSITTH